MFIHGCLVAAVMAGTLQVILETKDVLHVGCGAYAPEKLHAAFRSENWRGVRLDIDPAVASVTDMAAVTDARMDAVFSSHNLEHLYPHEVPVALKEFRRVLRPSGLALITLPDLQEVARLVSAGQLGKPAYCSPLAPISPPDMLYGCRAALADSNLFMAHHAGFTSQTLMSALIEAGFALASVQRVPSAFGLWAIAFPSMPSDPHPEEAQHQMFPLHSVLAASGPRG